MAALSAFLTEHALGIVEIEGDGNCFYRAIAEHRYGSQDLHGFLRTTVMEHIRSSIDKYVPYFAGSKKRFLNCIRANKREGVWSTEIADIAPLVMSELLQSRITIHDYDVDADAVSTFVIGEEYETDDAAAAEREPGEEPIVLLRMFGSHYELLKPVGSDKVVVCDDASISSGGGISAEVLSDGEDDDARYDVLSDVIEDARAFASADSRANIAAGAGLAAVIKIEDGL